MLPDAQPLSYQLLKSHPLPGGSHHEQPGMRPYKEDYIVDLARHMKNELGVKYAAPTHCTGGKAIKLFENVYGGDFVAGGLGTKIHFPR